MLQKHIFFFLHVRPCFIGQFDEAEMSKYLSKKSYQCKKIRFVDVKAGKEGGIHIYSF